MPTDHNGMLGQGGSVVIFQCCNFGASHHHCSFEDDILCLRHREQIQKSHMNDQLENDCGLFVVSFYLISVLILTIIEKGNGNQRLDSRNDHYRQ